MSNTQTESNTMQDNSGQSSKLGMMMAAGSVAALVAGACFA
jgi:hypothetical protein